MLWSLMFASLFAVCATLHWKTFQSSVSKRKRASDGDVTMTLCAETKEEDEMWWIVDLKNICKISYVTIARSHCHQHIDLQGAEIYIGYSGKNRSANSRCCHIRQDPQSTDMTFRCETAMWARYITVYIPGKASDLREVTISSTVKESPFHLFKMNKTWVDALEFCRGRNMELASILDPETQAFAALEAEEAESDYVWLGLRYTCTLGFWFWVDDHAVNYKHWASGRKRDECDMSGAMDTREGHHWSSHPDNKEFNFICTK